VNATRGLSGLLVSSAVLVLSACAPTSTTPNYTFEALPRDTAVSMVQDFASVLQSLEITWQRGSEVASRYGGSDGNAFLVIVDRFYELNPGFCPLEKNGFHADASGKVFLTLAAKGLEVRGFVYDLSSRPAVSFVTFSASSRAVLKTQPCRTVSGAP
jgi:hypothetical protein